MSNELIVNVSDGIEFYVASSGSVTGMSISGLARCCGVAKQTISEILNKDLVSGKELPKWLESFTGEVFVPSDVSGIENINNVKIVCSEICALVIEYYAYESKAKNKTAMNTFRKFAKKGIDCWIKEITGFEDKSINPIDKTLEILIDSINELKKDVKELKEIEVEYQRVRNGILITMPNLDVTLNRLADAENERLLMDTNDGTVTLQEYLIKKGVTPTRSLMCKMGRRLVEVYRTMKLELPITGNRRLSNGKYSTNVKLYQKKDIHILDMVYREYLAQNK